MINASNRDGGQLMANPSLLEREFPGNVVENSDNEHLISAEPKDRFHRVLLVFLLLGMTGLLPWNFFVTANGYWMHKLRDLNSSDPYDPNCKTDLQANFTSYLAVALVLPTIFAMILGMALSHRLSQNARIVGSLIVMIIIFFITLALVIVNTDGWQEIFLALTLASGAIINSLSGIFMLSAFGIVGCFKEKFIQAMMKGQSLCGITAAIAQLASLVGGTSVIQSAVMYFSMAIVFLVLCLIAYLWLIRQQFYLFYMNLVRVNEIDEINSERYLGDINSEQCFPPKASYWALLKQVAEYAYSGPIVLLASMMVMPSVLVLVVSEDAYLESVWSDKFFTPLTCFLLFNCGDFSGRFIASYVPFISSPRYILPLVSTLRVGLVPLVMLCNAHPRHLLPVVFNSDLEYVAIVCLLGVTNGYLLSTCMINIPKRVADRDRENAAILVTFLLTLGSTVGTVMSPLIIRLL